MAYINEPDYREVELEHLSKLSSMGFDYSCSGCGYMYKEMPAEGCEECDSREFSRTTELIRKLELSL